MTFDEADARVACVYFSGILARFHCQYLARLGSYRVGVSTVDSYMH